MLIPLFLFVTACNLDDHGYSVDNFWVGFGVIQKDTVVHTFQINLDDGSVLFPATYPDLIDRVKNNERVLANFTILGDKNNTDNQEQYYVRINSLRKILFKGILDITPAIEDSIGNDPIHVKRVWLKKGMLNFELDYRGGDRVHYINLVKQPGPVSDANGPVVLQLRHNKNGDNEHFPLSAIVTFKLESLKIAGRDSTRFKVIAKEFDGPDFEYSGTYNY
jgi:hypothetical protein